MKNKRGEGYIATCVMVVVLCMLLAVFITFVSAVNIVRMSERSTRNALDAFVMKNSILIYDSIKTGNDKTDTLDSSEFTAYFCALCELDATGYMLYNYDENGNEVFRMTKPQISFTVDGRLKVKVQYTMYVPLYLGGVKIADTTIPVTVESRYNEKF